MAKVLIALIGTGRYAKGDDKNNRYETTDYILDGKLYKDLAFTSDAIIKHFGIDRVYFIGTNKSMWDNLVERFGGDEEYMLEILEKKEEGNLTEEDLIKLGELIDNSLNGKGSRCFIVKDGENEEELWHIFEKFLEILDNLEEKDEVYFDITHLFRSLSVMSFVMAEFGSITHNINVKGMFYGMLKKDEPSKLINVAMFFEFLEWAKAFDELDRFASLDRLVLLANNKVSSNAYSVLQRMEEAFNIANMSAIYKEIQRLKTHLKYFEENENRIISFLAPRFREFIRRLDKKSLGDFQFALAEFFAERNNSALGYVALAEAIVTKIGEKQGLSEEDIKKEDVRKEIKNWIKEGFSKEFPYSHPRKKFADMFFNKINKIRNNICHQLENSKNAKHDIENLPVYIKKSKQFLKEIL
jgi:CRISPR-associated Csx2 family protein